MMTSKTRTDATRYELYHVQRYLLAQLPEKHPDYARFVTTLQSQLAPFKERTTMSGGDLKELCTHLERSAAPACRADGNSSFADVRQHVAHALRHAVDHIHEIPAIGHSMPTVVPPFPPERVRPAPPQFISMPNTAPHLGCDRDSIRFRKFCEHIGDKAKLQPTYPNDSRLVVLSGQPSRVGYYGSNRWHHWNVHEEDLPNLKREYERFVEAQKPPPPPMKPRGAPMQPGFVTKSALSVTTGAQHYRDPEFDRAWNKMIEQAKSQPATNDGIHQVILNRKQVKIGFFINGSTSSWYFAEESIPVFREYLDAARAKYIPTAKVSNPQLLGVVEVCNTLGLSRNMPAFKIVWGQMAAVASELPQNKKRFKLMSEDGPVEVVRGSEGDQLVRWAIDKSSVPAFDHAVQRMTYVQDIHRRAANSNDAGRDVVYLRAFTDSWNALSEFCSKHGVSLDELSNAPGARAAIFLPEQELHQVLDQLKLQLAEPSIAKEATALIDHVRDSRATARGEELKFFTR